MGVIMDGRDGSETIGLGDWQRKGACVRCFSCVVVLIWDKATHVASPSVCVHIWLLSSCLGILSFESFTLHCWFPVVLAILGSEVASLFIFLYNHMVCKMSDKSDAFRKLLFICQAPQNPNILNVQWPTKYQMLTFKEMEADSSDLLVIFLSVHCFSTNNSWSAYISDVVHQSVPGRCFMLIVYQ